MEHAESLAATLLGPEVMKAFLVCSGEGPERMTQGCLDVKAWLCIARRFFDEGQIKDEELIPAVIAIAALLFGAESVKSVDLSALEFAEVPAILRIFSNLRHLDLSRNSQLTRLRALRGELRALDLSDCSSLEDLRELSSLPFLEAVDLSRCTAVRDVTSLLLSRTQTARFKVLAKLPGYEPRGGYFKVRAVPVAVDVMRPALPNLGHPTLRYLSMSCCTNLRYGVQHVASCQALDYADFFGCEQVSATECLTASSQNRAFVWPSAEFIKLPGWPKERYAEACERGALGAMTKVRLAFAGARCGLPSFSGESALRSQKEALAAYAQFDREALQMSSLAPIMDPIEEHGSDQEELPIAQKIMTHRASPAKNAKERSNRSLDAVRISEDDFVHSLTAHKFEVNALTLPQLWQAVACDLDGIMLEDLEALAAFPKDFAQVQVAIEALLSRHRGSPSSAAKDLAGLTAEIDRDRMVSVLSIAGIDPDFAKEVTIVIQYCARGYMSKTDVNLNAALTHALNGFTMVSSAKLVANFLDFLDAKYPDRAAVFDLLDSNNSTMISAEEFNQQVAKVLQWPSAAVPGATDAVFRTLDLDGTGCITKKEWATMTTAFDPARLVEILSEVGIYLRDLKLSRRPKLLRQMYFEPLFSRNAWGSSLASTVPAETINSKEFSAIWKELGKITDGSNPSIVFALLDHNHNGKLSVRELLSLTDSLPRRMEAEAFPELDAFLIKRYGSMQSAHAAIAQFAPRNLTPPAT